jgi:hypothetical protein
VDALKKEFRHDAHYIIKVRNAGNDLIKRIESIPLLKKFSVDDNGSSYDYIQFEAVLDASNGNISHVIKKIIQMGGNITSLHEKELSLEEAFSKVVLK